MPRSNSHPMRAVWILAVALILLFAALTRFYNINKESFWADEGWTVTTLAKGPTVSDVVRTMADDQHPPFYFALLNVWMTLTGNSEVTTRTLSLFWSLIGIAAIYRLGADVYSPEVGVLAALFLAFSDLDTYLAQEVRHYTQMEALAIVSTLCYFRYFMISKQGITSKKARWYGIGWLLSSVALLYTHYLGGFILIVQLIHTLAFARPLRRLGDMLIRWGAICLAWLPWAFVFWNQSLVRYTRPVLYQSTLPNNANTFGILRGDLLGSHYGLMIALILIGLVYVAYRQNRTRIYLRQPTLYTVLWLLLPVAVIIGINPHYPILTPRNFLIIVPVIALLVAHGLMNLDRRTRLLLLTVMIPLNVLTVDAYFVKPPYRQVAKDILNYRYDNEPILLDVHTDNYAIRYHLGRDLGVDSATLPLVSLPDWRDQYGNLYYAELLQYLSDKDAFWMAFWGDPKNPDFDFFTQHGFVRTGVQFETHLDVNQIFIYRYDRVPTDKNIATFGNIIALKQFWLADQNYFPGDTVRVNLLFQAIEHPTVDYSVSVFLLDKSGYLDPRVQNDSSPLNGWSPTSSWQAGDLKFDSHTITIPRDLKPGTYTANIKIYWYGDKQPLPTTNPLGIEYIILKSIEVRARP